ncbi:MAG: hypothetical protein ACRYF0_19635 [Janthinobacterium lividum]
MADAPEPEATSKKAKPELPHCGVIMPISGTPDYPASHWADMLLLIQEAAKEAKFNCDIVSATGRDDIIHSSIVNNIYQNEMVVCDVSSRNPNVMLELGLRLASKLPIVVIFDGEGNYPFDIGTIRYLGYRRDMRYYDTQKFKKDLAAKILEVYDTYKKGNYKSFLSHFKNVDLNLDSITTETQSLGKFLENLDKRLSKFEAQGNSNNRPPVKTISQSLARSTIYGFIEGYLDANDKTFPGLKLPQELAREIFTAIRADKSLAINTLPPEIIAQYINDWEGQPF